MRVSVPLPGETGRLLLLVRADEPPWTVRAPGERGEALLDPTGPAFLAGGIPDWLRALTEAVDADRVLAEAIVREVERQR